MYKVHTIDRILFVVVEINQGMKDEDKPGSAFAGSGSEDGSARGTARLVRICRFKFNLVRLNIRGLNGCGRIDGAAVVVVVVVVDDGGSVSGSAVVGSENCTNIVLFMALQVVCATVIT